MTKVINAGLLLVVSVAVCAQNNALNSFSNSGGSILYNGSSSNPAHIGVIGQPLTGPVSGTLVVSNLMYSKDAHPPVITYSPSVLALRLNSENSIQYQATDNNPIVSNKIFYRPIGKMGPFESVDAPSPVSNTFTTSILPPWYDMMGMEYYIEVKDKENTTRHPTGAGRHFAYLTHPEPQVPTTLLSYGKTKNNYRIIAVPFATTNPITQLFAELGPSDKSKYRIFKYKSSEWREYPSFTTLDRGEGFFIIMSDALSDVVLSMPELQAPSNNRSELFELSLQPGWNLIGNPYTIDINWDNVLEFNDNPTQLASDLKVWTENGQYSNVKDLSAYQGAFVWLNGSQPLQIKVPFKGQRSPSGGRLSEEKNPDSWKINMVLHEGDEKNSLAAFGMHGEAELSFDKLDDLNPPALENFPIVKFLHPEHSQKYFVRDIVPPSVAHTWQVEIPATNNGERFLDWSIPDLSLIPSDLFLYDMARNTVVNMKTQSHYSFPSSAQKFKILFGSKMDEEIHPEKITVLPPYPNPVSDNKPLTFSIGLPKAETDYLVGIELFDGMGQQVNRHSWNLSPGLHEIKLPSDKTLRPTAGEIIYYSLEIGRTRFSGKLFYKP